jgi:hypothetical protein
MAAAAPVTAKPAPAVAAPAAPKGEPVRVTRPGIWAWTRPGIQQCEAATAYALHVARQKHWETLKQLEDFFVFEIGGQLRRKVHVIAGESFDLVSGLPFVRIYTEDFEEWVQLEGVDCPKRPGWQPKGVARG